MALLGGGDHARKVTFAQDHAIVPQDVVGLDRNRGMIGIPFWLFWLGRVALLSPEPLRRFVTRFFRFHFDAQFWQRRSSRGNLSRSPKSPSSHPDAFPGHGAQNRRRPKPNARAA